MPRGMGDAMGRSLANLMAGGDPIINDVVEDQD